MSGEEPYPGPGTPRVLTVADIGAAGLPIPIKRSNPHLLIISEETAKALGVEDGQEYFIPHPLGWWSRARITVTGYILPKGFP